MIIKEMCSDDVIYNVRKDINNNCVISSNFVFDINKLDHLKDEEMCYTYNDSVLIKNLSETLLVNIEKLIIQKNDDDYYLLVITHDDNLSFDLLFDVDELALLNEFLAQK